MKFILSMASWLAILVVAQATPSMFPDTTEGDRSMLTKQSPRPPIRRPRLMLRQARKIVHVGAPPTNRRRNEED